MAKRHQNGGVLEPITARYQSEVVQARPILDENGAPLVCKASEDAVEPNAQIFELTGPFDGKTRVAVLHGVPDPVTGGAWVDPVTNIVKARFQELWIRPGKKDGKAVGHIVHRPVEADASEQCVQFQISKGNRTVDSMEEEGFRLATKEEVLQRLQQADKNAKAHEDMKRARDPAQASRFLAEQLADISAKSVAGAMQAAKAEAAREAAASTGRGR